jgi:iron complex transport system ATP-binding protein
LSIAQRTQVAILGPNGCGKTTLLKVVNREIYPVKDDHSSVRILGRSNWNVWDLRSHIGIVSHDLQSRYRPQASGLEVVLSGFHSSIGIHGLLARRITATQRQLALGILENLGIADLAGTSLNRMSTGQQRRCLLGRALVHDPDTLILDEPTAGLDLSASFDYLGRVRRLVAAGKNIILVTHQLNEIPPDIERVILLKQGEIIADGAKDEVLTDDNLRRTYDTEIRVAKIEGNYLAYPPDPAENTQ